MDIQDKTKEDLAEEIGYLRGRVSELEQVKETLQKSESRFQALFENMGDAVAVYKAEQDGEDFVLIDFNKAAERIERTSRDEVIGRSVLKVFPRAKEVGLFDVFQRVWRTGRPEYRPVSEYKDNRIQGWRETFIYRLPSGEVVTIYSDQTDRIHAEEALRDSEEKYRLIFSKERDAIILRDEETHEILDVNESCERLYGYSRDEMLRMKVIDLSAEPEKSLATLRQGGQPEGILVPLRWHKKKDGTVFPVEISGSLGPFIWKGRRVVCSLIRDISDRKKAEDELREKERLLQSILSTSPVGIGLTRDRRIVWRNKAWESMFGFESEDEYLGESTRMLYPSEEEYERVQTVLYAPLCPGKTTETDVKFKRKDGTFFVVHMRMNFLDHSDPSKGVIASLSDISERKKAEEALQQSAQQMTQIIGFLPDATFAIDAEGKVIAWNRAIEEMSGVSAADMIGKENYEYAVPFYGTRRPILIDLVLAPNKQIEQTYALFQRNRDVLTVEADTATPLGRKVKLWARAAPLYDANGDVIGAIESIRDITERKLAEEALRESEEKYRVLVEKAHEGILVAQDGFHMFVNPAAEKIWGYSQEELLSRPFREFIHPYDRDMVVGRSLRRSGEKEIPRRYSFRILTEQGKTRWVEIDYSAVSWKGRPAELVLATDITERKQMEESLQSEKERFEMLAQNAPFGMLMVSEKGDFEYVNPRFKEMFGYDLSEVPNGREWFRRAYPDPTYRKEVIAAWIDHLQGHGPGETRSRIFTVTCKDGSEKIINFRPVRLGTGQDLVTCEDITERKQRERQLLESEQKYRTLFEESRDPVIITTRDGKVEAVNEAYLDLFGFTREEAEKMDILNIYIDPADRIRFQKDIERSGSLQDYEVRRRKKDGTEIECLLTSHVRLGEDGTIVGYQGIIRDVTERKQLQKQLIQAQKMEAIGTLAGGIAHDFNNLLQVTLGYSELLLRKKSKDDAEHADLQKIHHAARSGAELVQGLLTFSSKVESKPMPLDINRQVKGVEELLRRTIPRMIDIRLELAKGLKRVNADPARIEQVIINLAVNARDAMGESGSLIISTGNATLDAEYCRLRPEAKPGDYVLLSVSDTGQGMDKDTLVHIFEPFFTTKKVGRGTGLGLAMVYGIVQQHGGHITCCSEVGKGTTFKVYFPAIEIQMKQYIEDSDVTPALGNETLLLVDDEELVRELGIRILGNAGYQVLAARNGKEALDLYKKEGTQISLVILDWIMPEMGGKDCLHELLKINPRVKVLIASGYTTEEATKEPAELGAKGFVAKPFRVKQLLRDVRKTLDEN